MSSGLGNRLERLMEEISPRPSGLLVIVMEALNVLPLPSEATLDLGRQHRAEAHGIGGNIVFVLGGTPRERRTEVKRLRQAQKRLATSAKAVPPVHDSPCRDA